MNDRDLLVFPSELARRQYIRRKVLTDGIVDGSRLTTLAAVRRECATAARIAGRLKGRLMDDIEKVAVLAESTGSVRALLAPDGCLAALSDSALVHVLESLVTMTADLGPHAETAHAWLRVQQPIHGKLHQLGVLYGAYRDTCKSWGCSDRRDVDTAVLSVLRGAPSQWPAMLQVPGRRIVFTDIRWLSIFEESLIATLEAALGPERVFAYSALPPAHAEKWEDALALRVRTTPGIAGLSSSWAPWVETLADAIETGDPGLADGCRRQISFSRSAGLYGEVEDLARRICWEIEQHEVPPDQIALVVRDLGDYADAIANVFHRFSIPHFFRRGTPALAVPLIKAQLALLSFPARMERERLCSLLHNPSLAWKRLGAEADREPLIQAIRDSAAGPAVEPDELCHRLLNYLAAGNRAATTRRAVRGLQHTLRHLAELNRTAPLAEHAKAALTLIDDFTDPAAAETANSQVGRLESSGLLALREALDRFRASGHGASQPLSYSAFLSLVERTLENTTLRPSDSDESGVWILNPFDAAGLSFSVVVVASLNEGVFPMATREDAIFTDDERAAMRKAMTQGRAPLPRSALPSSSVLNARENILFLVSIGMARARLVLSCQACDTGGRKIEPSDFFRRAWQLAGWPSEENVAPSDYDAWRLARFGRNPFLAANLSQQRHAAPHERLPLPGESFLSVVPLGLSRAADERRQRIAVMFRNGEPESEATAMLLAAQRPAKMPPSGDKKLKPDWSQRLGIAIHERLRIELGREAFFNTPCRERDRYVPHCGKMAPPMQELSQAWLRRHGEVSPTALENLARCRFRFLMADVFGIRTQRTQEDEPDALDRGRVLHQAIDCAYRALRGDIAELQVVAPAAAAAFAGICRCTAWARREENGTWLLTRTKPPPDSNAIPLVSFDLGDEATYHRLMDDVAEACLRPEGAPQRPVRLGNPSVWETEIPKIAQVLRNYISIDVQHAREECRYPALFEFAFGHRRGGLAPDVSALSLAGLNAPLHIHGVIDRVDLCFGDRGLLTKILVVDYKGKSRGKLTEAQYAEEIALNLNCQLPLYGFASQQTLLGRHNIPEANALTELVYHVQDRNLDEMGKQFVKRRIRLDSAGEASSSLGEQFVATLGSNVALLRNADFSVDPLDCNHCEYSAICRVDVNALDPADDTP